MMIRAVAGLAACGALAAGCGGAGGAAPAVETVTVTEAAAAAAPAVTEVSGKLRLYGAENFTVNDNGYEWCLGAGDYEDLYYGTPVTVTDADGRKVALGELDEGELSPDRNICSFAIEVEGVPNVAGVYTVSVSEDRGGQDIVLPAKPGRRNLIEPVLGNLPSVDDPWTTDDGLTQAEADCLNSRPDDWESWEACVD